MLVALSLAIVSCGFAVSAQERKPPQGAFEDCRGRQEGDVVQHTTPQGVVSATCTQTPDGLVARPATPDMPSRMGGDRARPAATDGKPQVSRSQDRQTGGAAGRYSLEQALSDKAQRNTIAFDGLAFLTGDFGADTFLPPGKVSDYFGFQYMRDIDAAGAGHSTSFLTRIAHNVLHILNDAQKEQLVALAREQEADIRRFALMRFPLIAAFRRNLEGQAPAGSNGLSRDAVVRQSAALYELDGELAYHRARVMGTVLQSLTPQQKGALARLQFGDSRTWPDVPEPLDKRSMPHEIHVAVMTYVSEMFSWQGGNIEADTYFCPERHGMYFGGFGMKTAPAMGKPNYAISTSLTGDSGEAFLSILTPEQRGVITSLPDMQRQQLREIVSTRRAIAAELRRFLVGHTADKDRVLSLSRRYGELDGDLSHMYATAFARVGKSLSQLQKSQLQQLRASNPEDPKGPFLYSRPVTVGKTEDTDQYFAPVR